MATTWLSPLVLLPADGTLTWIKRGPCFDPPAQATFNAVADGFDGYLEVWFVPTWGAWRWKDNP